MLGKSRGRVLVTGGLSVACLMVAAVLQAQGPGRPQMPPGGGPPGGFQAFGMRMMVERAALGSWAFVSFELGVSDEKLVELRKVYQENWKVTRASLEKLQGGESGAGREIMQGVMESQRELRESVKAALTDEQGEKLDEWYEQQRQQSMRGAPGGGPPRGERRRG